MLTSPPFVGRLNYDREMILLLLRHGDAGKAGLEWPDDRLRPLSRLGHRQSRAMGKWARKLGLKPSHAFTSPLARACETAQDFLRAWKSPPRLKRLELLAPGGDPGKTLASIRGSDRNIDTKAILLVGHNPDMGGLAKRLGAPLHFGKGSLAVISWDGRPELARLEMFVRAELMAEK